MIEVVIHDVVPHVAPSQEESPPTEGRGQLSQPTWMVQLKERSGDRLLPVWMRRVEGEALALLLADVSMPRPLTHDLIVRILGSMEARLVQVSLDCLHADLYYATLSIRYGTGVQEIDAPVGDALILALLLQVPIMVDSSALEHEAGRQAPHVQTRETPPQRGLVQRDMEAEPKGADPTMHAPKELQRVNETNNEKSPVPRRHTSAIAPGPRGHVLLGNLLDFRRDPLTWLMDTTRQYGDVVRFRLGPWTSHLVTHPEAVKQVLQDHAQNYRKGRIANRFKIVIGESMLASEGTFWRRQRRLAQPAFHRRRIAGLVATMVEATGEMLERWRTFALNAQPLDLAAEMMQLTLRMAGRTLFGTDLSTEAGEVGRAAATVIHYANDRFTRLFPLPPRIPTPSNRRFQQAMRTLDTVVQQLIDTARQKDKDRGDLLSMLVLARDEETGEGMSDEQLRDEIRAFLLAGHETTASALAWTWYLLSQHAYVERQLHAELVTVLGGRPPTFEDLPHLRYTKMVLEEAMRLYPPGWGFERRALSDDEIGGYHIPAHSLVFVSPYVTHRHPDFWEHPDAFDPGRFVPEQTAQRPRYAYFPFGGGPRQCIGNEFAIVQCQVIIAMVAQTYRFTLLPGSVITPEPTVTLRPHPGVPVTLASV